MKSFKKLRLIISLVLASANVLILVLSGYSLIQSKDLYEQQAATASQNIASALDQSVSKSIEKIDMAIHSVTDEFERQMARGKIDDQEINAFMLRASGRMPEIEAMRISNADGLVMYGNLVDKSKPINVADRNYFKYLRDHADAGLFISEPLFGKISKHYVIIFAQRINAPGGQFAGVAYATIPLDFFTQLMATFDIGRHGAIALRDNTLGLMTRLPASPDKPGGQISNKVITPELQGVLASGVKKATFLSIGGADNTDRLASIRKLDKAPVIVIVGLAREEYLAEWWIDAYKTIGFAGIFLLFSIIAYIGSLRLIAESEKQEEKIRELAFYDQLTGLPSLRLGEDRLGMTLNQAKRQQCKVGVMFIDLDGFKSINDSYGHEAGDCVLKEVAARLNDTIRAVDTAVRIGGDEFLIILGAIQTENNASEVAEKILEAIRAPIPYKEQLVHVGCSIGISVFPLHASNAAELRRNADAAMYEVKRTGKNSFAFFDPEIQQDSQPRLDVSDGAH